MFRTDSPSKGYKHLTQRRKDAKVKEKSKEIGCSKASIN
jgi:hypothetical protein